MAAEFRPAAASDVETIVELAREYYAGECYPFDEEAARRTVSRLVADPSLGRLWLIADGDAVAGYVALTLGYSLEYRGRDAFLDELYVRPGHRGRGLGDRAVAIAEAACRELGVKALHLEVERDNTRARSLYRKWGFEDHDRLLMTKRIADGSSRGAIEPLPA